MSVALGLPVWELVIPPEGDDLVRDAILDELEAIYANGRDGDLGQRAASALAARMSRR